MEFKLHLFCDIQQCCIIHEISLLKYLLTDYIYH